ncbi:MAG TPA: TetR/AcrR family transcriptional regulator [Pseudoduganella sp.]
MPNSQKSASKGGGETLCRERIQTAALELIDQDGLQAFSMRKLGKLLGCEAMSIYHHFPNKEHILDSLVERLVAGIRIPPRSLHGLDRLRALARNWREMTLRHPNLWPLLMAHRLNSEICLTFLNEVFVALRDTGLDRETAARLFRVVAYFMMGAALDEIAGYAKGPSSLQAMNDEELAQRFPLIGEAGEFFRPEHFERTFEAGLELFLRGAGLLGTESDQPDLSSATDKLGP